MKSTAHRKGSRRLIPLKDTPQHPTSLKGAIAYFPPPPQCHNIMNPWRNHTLSITLLKEITSKMHPGVCFSNLIGVPLKNKNKDYCRSITILLESSVIKIERDCNKTDKSIKYKYMVPDRIPWNCRYLTSDKDANWRKDNHLLYVMLGGLDEWNWTAFFILHKTKLQWIKDLKVRPDR